MYNIDYKYKAVRNQKFSCQDIEEGRLWDECASRLTYAGLAATNLKTEIVTDAEYGHHLKVIVDTKKEFNRVTQFLARDMNGGRIIPINVSMANEDRSRLIRPTHHALHTKQVLDQNGIL